MSEAVFLDTSGWIALLNAQDSVHAQASRVWAEVGLRGGDIIVTDWVVAETGNGLAKYPARSGFADGVRRFEASPRGRLITIDKSYLGRALSLYDQRRDKTWGLVDCASFVVMWELGIYEAMTLDHHFEQAGFRCLLNGSDEINGH